MRTRGAAGALGACLHKAAGAAGALRAADGFLVLGGAGRGLARGRLRREWRCGGGGEVAGFPEDEKRVELGEDAVELGEEEQAENEIQDEIRRGVLRNFGAESLEGGSGVGRGLLGLRCH